MGQPKITEEQIIAAGEQLEREKPRLRISGWQISKLIDEGGNTNRMQEIWDKHVAARGVPTAMPAVDESVDEKLAVLLRDVSQQTEAYVRADRAAREKKHADTLRVLICEKDDQLSREQADRAQVEQMLGDRDDDLDQLQERLDRRDAQIEMLTPALARLENDLAERAEALAQAQQRLLVSGVETASAHEREAALRAQLEARKAETAAVTAEARAHAARADHAESRVASLMRDINNIKNAQEAIEVIARQREQDAVAAKQRADVSEARAALLEQQIADLTARAVEAEDVVTQQPKEQKKASRTQTPPVASDIRDNTSWPWRSAKSAASSAPSSSSSGYSTPTCSAGPRLA